VTGEFEGCSDEGWVEGLGWRGVGRHLGAISCGFR
jgi:hypothetical protein